MMSKTSPKDEALQNPDSSSEKLDVTEVDDDVQDIKDIKDTDKDKVVDSYKHSSGKHVETNDRNCEGVNLSLRLSKTAITLVRQKDDLASSEKDNVKCSRETSRHVWRPY